MVAPSTPTDPTILAEVADGAMSVNQAMEFTGDCRARLFQLMEAGVLEWYYVGPHRRILRKSLREYVARMYAEHKANPQPRPSPKAKKGACTSS